MANRNAVIQARSSAASLVVKWTGLLSGDIGIGPAIGTPPYINLPSYPDRTVQITGVLGVGGSVQIEGSNDGGTTWSILTDTLGNNLVFTAVGGMKQITELPDMIRPKVTAGDGTTNFGVYISTRGTPGGR